MSDTASGLDRPRGGKGREAFRTISEVADELDLPQHVLRFWESKFTQIKPLKRGGNRRYYRPDDVTLLKAIKKLLHADGYTIRGVQKLFKAQGVKTTIQEALEMDMASNAVPVMESAPAVEQHEQEGHDEVREEGGSSDTEALKAVLSDLKALREKLG